MSLPSFGVRQPVVANLVMFAVIAAGVIFGVNLTREFFPEVRPNLVSVVAPYPGAAPEEVEEALAIKIEDQLVDLNDVEEINTTVSEGIARVRVEYREGVNIEAAVAEVKREVDALQDLPDGSDRIVVSELQPNLPAIVVSLYGDADERAMKKAAREIRDDLRSLPGMGDISIGGDRRDEIVVEARPAALLAEGLSLTALSERINRAMIELPGGSVRTETANVALRSMGVEERAQEVRDIVVRSEPDGRVVRVRDVAGVRFGFADVDFEERLNGKPAVNLTVFKKGDEDIVLMAEMVKAYVAGVNGEGYEPTLSERVSLFLQGMRPGGEGGAEPEPVSGRMRAYRLGLARSTESLPGVLATTTDLARFVVGRLELLTRNALWGGALVFLILVALLNWRVSFWVALGLIISLLGTLVMMRFVGITLNLLSMFGLIVVIGILVDDAIVVAENISSHHERGEPALSAAIGGTNQVAWPVVATVLTTVCAFMPLSMIGGRIGDLLAVLPLVVACALLISLVECLFILPSHMGHSLKHADRARASGSRSWFARLERKLDHYREALFSRAIGPVYLGFLRACLRARYTTTAVAVAAVVASVGMVAGKRVEFIFFEANDAETINVELRMPVGMSLRETDAVARRLEAAVEAQEEVRSFYTAVGSIGAVDGSSSSSSTHLAQLIMELEPVERRDRTSEQIIQSIRDQVGVIPGARSLRIEGVAGGPDGPAISLTIVGEDEEEMEAAAEALMEGIGAFEGVVDLSTDSERGQREIRFSLRDGASELGFTRAELGRQIQGFVFGLEAFTFAGDREDVDVRVMMPERVRRSLAEIEDQHVFTPDGRAVPLREVAEIEEGESYATIRRFGERTRPKRAIAVTADVDRSTGANPEEIAASLGPVRAKIERDFPGVDVVERGRQKDVAEAFETLPIGFLAASGLIYVILAWLFASYAQPLIVMTAIPFATVGMIWGHVVMGYSMTFLSLIGFVALAGVVVNDSLIFMEFFNSERKAGKPVYEAALAAGRARIRAILLTTVTTVFGLLPLMLEQSFQARFLIPMAITISFGLMSATAIILIVLPCLLMILQDLNNLAGWLWSGRPMQAERVYEDPATEVANPDAPPGGSHPEPD